jgi:iron complex outermembrane receptor protein
MRANRVLKLAVAYTLAAASSMALAQTPPSDGTITELETVIVTGTYIRGSAEDAALPVDVISTEDLQKQGSPSMVDLAKQIPAMQGVVGESNQFLVSAAAGTASVNLRGLGPLRTLVLLNGRRLAPSPTNNGVDTNLLPAAAISRVEILKDGAASTYGSDAIAGVVNFITHENLSGFAFDVNYAYIDGSDGDYGASGTWGWQGDSNSLLLSVGYRHRSELSTLERDWALRPVDENPQGGWSLAGTGAYAAGAGFTTRVVDPACNAYGGTTTTTPVPGGPFNVVPLASATECRFQYTAFDNLVEEENHYQAFAKYDHNFTDSTSVYVEGLWAMHDVPHENVSPSYGPNQSPTGGSAPNYFVPLANPGLAALMPFLTVPQQNAVTASGGVVASGLLWRPLAQGGNPAAGGKAQHNSRKFDGMRFSTGVESEFAGVTWQVNAAYAENNSELETPDFLVARLGRALAGFGGPNCTGAVAGDAAAGCFWLNPFSTGVAANSATGAPNTVSYVPGLEPNADLIRWITTPNSAEDKTTLLTFETVFNGELPFAALPGGDIGWAVGAQYRDSGYERVVTDPFADISKNPCAQSPINPATVCTAQNGAMSFYGPLVATDVSQDVVSGFAEFSFPILDSLQAQLAVRHEAYGGSVGSTTNPKLSLRFQPLDWLTFRASGGSTFRAPQQTQIGTSSNTTLAFVFGSYRAFDTFQNPNLKPETADTLNGGFVIKAGGFTGSVDYWQFAFDEALAVESGAALLNFFFGDGTALADKCDEPQYAALQSRFTFSGGTCLGSNLTRTRLNQINSTTEIEISGIDASLQYRFNGLLGGGDLTIGADGTYNLAYDLGPSVIEGFVVEEAVDAIGTRGGRGGTQVQWKGSGYIDAGFGAHNLRFTSRYIDGVTDERGAATFGSIPGGKQIDSFLTHDLSYLGNLPGNVTISASVINLTDEDPPFARLDLNYEPFIANPLGRYFKVGAGVKF